jgi:hypothetical protein
MGEEQHRARKPEFLQYVSRVLTINRSDQSTNSTASKHADKWFEIVENMNLLLEKKRKEPEYDPVKIAILDTGIQGPYWNSIAVYKDFVSGIDSEGTDITGHGTNGVHLALQIIPEAKVYVARIFEGQEATGSTRSLMAQVGLKHQ